MRGYSDSQPMIIAYINLEKRVPAGHPLRKIKPLADQELKRLSPLFNEMYSHTGRPSIPPERVLKSLLLIALYSVRSERQFCEQRHYNLLFRGLLQIEWVIFGLLGLRSRETKNALLYKPMSIFRWPAGPTSFDI